MFKHSRIYVAGRTGLVGSALVRKLVAQGYTNLILPDRLAYDLRSRLAVRNLFIKQRPEYVFLAAAKVGGILANSTQPGEFLYDNLTIQTNVIHACQVFGVQKLCFFGSSCIYPRDCPQPIKEEYLLAGPLEETNDAYAVAKIAGIKMCQAYRKQYGLNVICLMPTNLYGPGDNFNPETSHVVAALMRKYHEAKRDNAPAITLWGTGSAFREFMHVDDLASAAVFLMQHYDSSEIMNVGTGEEITIRELLHAIERVIVTHHMTGYEGYIAYDPSKPNGTPRKLLDVSKIHALGWHHKIELEAGLRSTYEWFLEHAA